MGTGIVSVGFSLDHRETLSRTLLAIAGVVWIALALLGLGRVLHVTERARSDARSPAALSSVAATAVLATSLVALGWRWAGITLLAVALACWLILLGPVLRHWVTPTDGASLMLTVSTESLAVLSATIALRDRISWLLYAALGAFLLGLAGYLFGICRFDRRQLVTGPGDHWITGGALAISTLAAGLITLDGRSMHELARFAGTLQATSVALWVLAVAWLPILLAAEVIRPRLVYDVRRWATVFPVGMYAACSFVIGSAAHAAPITDFARIWIWAALITWIAVFTATVRRGIRSLSTGRGARQSLSGS